MGGGSDQHRDSAPVLSDLRRESHQRAESRTNFNFKTTSPTNLHLKIEVPQGPGSAPWVEQATQANAEV